MTPTTLTITAYFGIVCMAALASFGVLATALAWLRRYHPRKADALLTQPKPCKLSSQQTASDHLCWP